MHFKNVYIIYVIVVISISTTSCSTNKYNFKKKQYLNSLEIFQNIKDDKLWEEEFISQLFDKCVIVYFGHYILMSNENINRNDGFYLVSIKTSNSIYYKIAENSFRYHYKPKTLTSSDEKFWIDYRKNIYQKPKVEIFQSISWSKIESYNEEIYKIFGEPISQTNENYDEFDMWNINGYNIKISKSKNKIIISLNY